MHAECLQSAKEAQELLLERQPRATRFLVPLQTSQCIITGWYTAKNMNQLFYNIANGNKLYNYLVK